MTKSAYQLRGDLSHAQTVTRDTIGPLLRAGRIRRGLTLAKLAEAAGVSVSFLSQLERGLSSASVSSLRRITGALEITMADLFNRSELMWGRVFPASSHPTIEFGDGATKRILSAGVPDEFEVFRVDFQVGGSTGAEPYGHGASTEFLLVQAGRIQLQLDNDVHVLGAGDSIVYPSSHAHRLENVSAEVSTVLWVIGPPDPERGRK